MLGLLITLLAFYFYFQPAQRHLSVFLLFILVTAGFQLIPVVLIEFPALGITKCYDWLLIFCGMIFLFRPLTYLRLSLWKKYKNVGLFLLTLVVLSLYSVYWAGVEVSVTIRVFRIYIYFISLFLFLPLSTDEIKKALVLVIYSTSLASLLYCTQMIHGVFLLNGIVSQETAFAIEGGLPRYYNLPVFVLPVLFFFFFKNGLLNIKFAPLLGSINLLAILLSQHRSMLFTLIILFILNLLLEKRIQPVKLVFLIGIGLGLFLFVDGLLGGRFTSGFKDLSEASSSFKISDIKYIQYQELPQLSTSDFRKFHFLERFLYVVKKPDRAMFGIGLATEDSRIVKQLSFTVGTTSEDNSSVPQISTADIAWSLLILHLGILGIVSFLYFYGGFLVQFIALRKYNVMKIGIYFILYLFITSFYGWLIMQPYTLCLLMLFVAFAYQQQMLDNRKESVQQLP